MQPELRALERDLNALRGHPVLNPVIGRDGRMRLSDLSVTHVATLLADSTAALFLLAAADLNRTALRSGIQSPDAQLVPAPHRRAFVVRSQLPRDADFATVVELALQRRAGTVGRSANAATETLFRERLAFEGLPIRMRGAWTSGLLIDRRKPDGVYPDPDTGEAPRLYLEIKKVNRVRDDIQKRLYEIAQVSLEMKFLYGDLSIQGLELGRLLHEDDRVDARRSLRAQTHAAAPAVVALLICRAEELEIARRYRPRIEAFIDRLFFADEIDACLEYLSELVTET